LQKNKLLLIPFSAGLLLLVCSWFLSYPLTITSINDLLFNHISILYWFGFSLLITSMYVMTLSTKNSLLKWILTLGIIATFFSLSYFFYMMPGSDWAGFSGLTKYFMETKSLDISQFNHNYFQWPNFWILAEITTSVSGIELAQFQFLEYALIGFLLTSTLYVYASRFGIKDAQTAVVTYFIVVFYILNYQAVPFSLALCLLFVLFMLETRPPSSRTTFLTLVVYVSLCFTHAFVPLFFVLYLLLRSVISRSKKYGLLCLITSGLYFLLQVLTPSSSLFDNIRLLLISPVEFQGLISRTLVSVSSTNIQEIVQMFSRTVVIAFATISLIGFVLLLVKRKLRDLDKAIFFSGLLYAGLGFVFSNLGTRAIQIFLIPVSLGAAYLFKGKLRPYLRYIFLFLIILTVFIPAHTTLVSRPVAFATRTDLETANFVLEKFDWNEQNTILSSSDIKWYMYAWLNYSTSASAGSIYDQDALFQDSEIEVYDIVVYSTDLGIGLTERGLSAENATGFLVANRNVIYDSGYSFIAEKTKETGS
jgi:hypothetical protein